MIPYLDDGDVVLYQGDSLELLADLEPESIDAVVTDPPYGLEFMGAEWDTFKVGKRPAMGEPDGTPYRRKTGTPSWSASGNPPCLNCGGTRYDSDDARGCRCDAPRWANHALAHNGAFQEWCQQWAELCLRALKPGGHLLASCAPRTYHRLACGVEDAGFEVRDEILAWMFGQGFPKSLNPGCRCTPAEQVLDGAVDGHGWPLCATCGLVAGLGTAVKPCHEPILMARKPIARTVAATLAAHGTGVLNIDGCRIGRDSTARTNTAEMGYHGGNAPGTYETGGVGRWPGNVALIHGPDCREVGERAVTGDARAGGEGKRPNGIYGQQPNGDPAPNGRLYGDDDGLERVTAWECQPGCPVAALDAQAGERPGGAFPGRSASAPKFGGIYNGGKDYAGRVDEPPRAMGDTGSASRFFYTAKASTAERDGSKHPTVKPLALMRWLCRLVTPPGGVVLDPFAGSGTTLLAARREGFRAIGMEREDQWCADIAHRLRELSLFGGVS